VVRVSRDELLVTQIVRNVQNINRIGSTLTYLRRPATSPHSEVEIFGQCYLPYKFVEKVTSFFELRCSKRENSKNLKISINLNKVSKTCQIFYWSSQNKRRYRISYLSLYSRKCGTDVLLENNIICC
jgi:hypothetical protein